jgi:PhoH-like ATPase
MQESPNQLSNALDDKKPETYGVKLENGSRLMIELNHIETIKQLDSTKNDNRILSVAKYFANALPSHDVELLSMDAALRIKSDANSVTTRNYHTDDMKDLEDADAQYSGVRVINVSHENLQRFKKNSFLEVEEKLNANEYVVLQNGENSRSFALGRFSKKENGIVPIVEINNLWGVQPKNIEQMFAVDALLNPEIPLVTLSGKAGTGKTLLSVAAGLIQSLDQATYKKMLISRPVVPLGKDIGYLPGDMNEKMNPYMQSIFDNLEFIMSLSGGGKNSGQRYNELIDQG